MTVFTDNPAGRLQALLISFKRSSSLQPVLGAWGAALAVPARDVAELLRRLSLVNELPGQIEAEVGMIDKVDYDRDVILRWHDAVVPVLGSALITTDMSTSADVAERIDGESLLSLQACSDLLHRHRPEQPIQEAEIWAVRKAIAELLDAVDADPGAGPEFRQFLQAHAQAMARALDDVPIRGRAALAGAFDLAVGAVVHEEHRFKKSGDTRRTGWKKFLKMIGVVSLVLGISANALAMPASIRSDMKPAPVETVKVEVIETPPGSQIAEVIEGPPGSQIAEVIEAPPGSQIIIAPAQEQKRTGEISGGSPPP